MKKNSMFKRFISLALSLVLVASCLPAGLLPTASAAGESTGIISADTKVDPSTLDSWKDTSFNPYKLTTEHAGGVWTDKTVVKAGDAQTVFVDKNGDPLGITAGTDNFLVALSALGANSVVAGQGSTPTDTIFVLDLSNSMENTDLREMVTAANDAIHSLLTSNPDNRVGVVVYSTNVNVLLALDRYTPVVKGNNNNRTNAYIEMSDNYGQIRTARISSGFFGSNTTYVKDSSGNNETTSISASGATYIQGGLWQAMEEFNDATVTDKRTPVLVLMSDGAPSYGTEDYNNVSSRDVGNGGTGSITDGLAFLTQLTAAFVKEKIADKYNTDAYFYSVGLGVSESGQDVSIAEAVLDTSKTREDPEDWWTTYLGLADKTTKTMSFNAAGENVTVTYDPTITSSSKTYTNRYFPASDASQLSAAFQGIVNEINLKSSYNVTRIEGADAHSGGYVTFVDEIGTGMEVKDIKGILVGDTLYTGQRLAQALLNQEFGTADEPTVLGDNMVWALKQRLGITDLVDPATGHVIATATERVHDLIRQAYDAGQIAYNAQTGAFSNLICWFSDANGDYLGFWDHDDPNCVIPEGAAYANASYSMLGTTTDSQTAHASDMMYVAVMVSKQVTQVGGQPALEAKTPELITFRVPAALLPTVTYQIDVQASTGEEITEQTPATITYNEAEPIRLVYEVGVHSELTPENIKDFLRPGYQAKDSAGNYYLYTNAWYWDGADNSDWNNNNNHPDKGDAVLYDTSKNHISYAYFEPSEQNEHYYYTEKTGLWVKTAGADTEDTSDDVYERLTTAPVTNGSVKYYFQHKTYVAKNAATETGVAVDAQVDIHYGEVSQKLLEDSNNYAQDATTGVYYIKEGTMHYHTIHEHDKLKTENATGSFKYRLHQLVDIAVDGQNVASHHYEIMYLGNNGRISYSPAQGFTLSKVMAAGAEATGSFTFDVTVSADADGKYTETRDGVSTEKALTNNAFTVSLAAGEQVTITGIDVGATYTVTEQERDGYKLDGIVVSAGSSSGATATGTVAENQIHSITYTNDIQQYGSLLVTKDVTYNKISQPQTDPHTFRIVVKLEGMADKLIYANGTPITLNADGEYIFFLADGGQMLITGIPEGVAYTVTEPVEDGTTNVPYGYTEEDGYTITAGTASGTIVKNETATAAVQNTYTPDDVVITQTEPQISIDVTKFFHMNWGAMHDGNYSLNQRRTFNFELLTYNTAAKEWKTVKVNGSDVTAQVTISNPYSYLDPTKYNEKATTISMVDVALDSVGSHYFRVAEVVPKAEDQQAGMTYDRTFHDFEIVVTDADLDGKLEIAEVKSLQHAVVSNPIDENNDGVAEHWNVSTKFYNYEITHSTKLTLAANKTLAGATLKDGQFGFALYKVSDDTFDITGVTPIVAKNGANGEIVFTTETYPFASGTTDYYYVMEEQKLDDAGNPIQPNANGAYVYKGVTMDKKVWEIQVKVEGLSSGEAQINGIEYREKGQTSWTGHVTGAPVDNVFNAISFGNTYTAEPVEEAVIKANKTLTNLTPGVTQTDMDVPANTYEFKLEAIAGAPMPANAVVYAADGGEVNFGTIKYEKAGTYEYKLTEIDNGVAGVTYDGSEYTVTVTVSDDGAGQLEVASVVYTKNGVNSATATFENTYKASPITGLKLHAQKVLTVGTGFERDLNANDFRATLTHPDGTTETVYNDANGIFHFSPLSFDAVGRYNYSISEVIPHGAVNNKFNGMTYDAAAKVFTIEVTDNGAGQLVAKLGGQTLSSTSTLAATIENAYAADPTTIHLIAHKDLVGRDLNADEFSFKLEAIAGAPMPAADEVRNDANGTVDFGTITYNAVGVYQYKVTELKLDENGDPIVPTNGEYVYKGVTYSVKEYIVTVHVDDLQNGKLIAHVSSVDQNGKAQPGGIVFTNTYKAAPVTVNVEGDDANTGGKIFTDESSLPENRKDMDDFAFKFRLTELDGTVIQTVEDNGAGFAFADIEYTQTGVYQYLIYEVPTGEPGVEFDQAKYRVTVIVTDNGEGALAAAVKYEKAESGESDDYETTGGILFQNSYKAKETSVSFAGKKTLTGGRELKANDFSFVLKNAKSGDEIATVKNDAEGVFAFSKLTYNSEGTYTYTLEEVKGNAEGITYDTAKYTLTVTVKDVNGELKATTAITKDGKAADSYGFTNIYTPKAVGTSVEVQKVLVNKSEETVGLNGFVFQLDNGTEKMTLTTGSDGKVKFDLSFDAADIGQTYTYKLSEVKGDKTHMTYDAAVYEIKVIVKQAPTGELELAVSRTGTGAFQFTNTYEPPVAEEDDPPKTGDESNIGKWTLMLAVSAVGVLAVLVLGKKKLFEQ